MKEFDFYNFGIQFKKLLTREHSVTRLSKELKVSRATLYRCMNGKKLEVVPLIRIHEWMMKQSGFTKELNHFIYTEYPCYACQGGGCPVCCGYGVIREY